MKKILSLILSLSLLCGAVAFADNTITNESGSQSASTTITYTIEQNEEYIVTIPAALTLSHEGDALPAGTMTVSISAENYNVPNHRIRVILGSAAFQMTHENGDDYMPYKITKYSTEYGIDDVVAECYVDETNFAEAELTVQVTSLEHAKAAGDYSDTITFYVEDCFGNQESLPI